MVANCLNRTSGRKMIYADNAATTRLDLCAFEAMKPFLTELYGNASQTYSFSRKVKDAIKHSREIIASSIGAKPEEIFFTSGGTESDNWALFSAAQSKRNEIITSCIEHHAILRTCNALSRYGKTTKYLPVNKRGIVVPEALQNVISDKVAVVSIMHANNEIGSISPIRELSEITHEKGVLFHSDAVQSVGHIEVNVKDLGVDMLSASAHKFNGPKGVGFLYVKEGLNLTPFILGGMQEYGMRAGTENVASIVGMAAALQNNVESLRKTKQHLSSLENIFFRTLKEKDVDFLFNGSENHLPGLISISLKKVEGELMLHRLDLKGICISTGAACNSTSMQISHVIKGIGVPDEYAKGTIRISFGKNNTEEEAIIVASEIAKILESV